MQTIILYVTVTSISEAERLGKVAIENRLAACVNILGRSTSIYRWEGAVTVGDEVVMIFKTTENLRVALTKKIKSMHSYACPCIAVLPIHGGNNEFLEWIHNETSNTVVD
ncbi:MAG: hypothetical protein CBB68_03870 [Rhodospirillaceae bacterium TMED8]|nr:divalent-cation tolerance protein CutA [Magnetovibrio sp.]OUT52013.1 MAG: hypothetical protein CBB68_03870 [Rhodospirillaceae bacterium TMED8]|tara:strand:+ start:5202 stop:5531 length:330 start_codon:yes stop_codon:yes gene_type:complete